MDETEAIKTLIEYDKTAREWQEKLKAQLEVCKNTIKCPVCDSGYILQNSNARFRVRCEFCGFDVGGHVTTFEELITRFLAIRDAIKKQSNDKKSC